jgi:hypothetical protein
LRKKGWKEEGEEPMNRRKRGKWDGRKKKGGKEGYREQRAD